MRQAAVSGNGALHRSPALTTCTNHQGQKVKSRAAGSSGRPIISTHTKMEYPGSSSSTASGSSSLKRPALENAHPSGAKRLKSSPEGSTPSRYVLSQRTNTAGLASSKVPSPSPAQSFAKVTLPRRSLNASDKLDALKAITPLRARESSLENQLDHYLNAGDGRSYEALVASLMDELDDCKAKILAKEELAFSDSPYRRHSGVVSAQAPRPYLDEDEDVKPVLYGGRSIPFGEYPYGGRRVPVYQTPIPRPAFGEYVPQVDPVAADAAFLLNGAVNGGIPGYPAQVIPADPYGVPNHGAG